MNIGDDDVMHENLVSAFTREHTANLTSFSYCLIFSARTMADAPKKNKKQNKAFCMTIVNFQLLFNLTRHVFGILKTITTSKISLA